METRVPERALLLGSTEQKQGPARFYVLWGMIKIIAPKITGICIKHLQIFTQFGITIALSLSFHEWGELKS